jgi:hypothetical protein
VNDLWYHLHVHKYNIDVEYEMNTIAFKTTKVESGSTDSKTTKVESGSTDSKTAKIIQLDEIARDSLGVDEGQYVKIRKNFPWQYSIRFYVHLHFPT